jgi:asparagine synthase (glutamine-hydrolysing)
MFSYIAFAWDTRNPAAAETAQALAHRMRTHVPHLEQVFDASGLQVFCATGQPGSNEALPLHGNAGIVLGAVFERNGDECEPGPSRRARFDEHQTRAILATRGAHLIKANWGRYVALLRDPEAHTQWVLRDPTSTLPCFHTMQSGLSIFFSHLPDLEPLQLPPWRIDGNALRVRVAAGMLHAGSILENVSQVYGGECLELSNGKVKRQFYWTPLAAADRDPIQDADYAARALRATVKSAIHTWAGAHASIILRASGGLDSSIVAGCLRDAPSHPRLACFTSYVPQNRFHNLPWSRAIAAHLGVQPHEIVRNPRVDWSGLMRLPATPSPVCDAAAVETSATELALAREHDATAIFTGDGGDSLFGASSARVAAREYLRRNGLRWGLLEVAENVALLRELTVWSVLGDALRTRRVEPNEYARGTSTRRLVHREVFETFHTRTDYQPHPWYATSEPCPWSVILRLGTLSQLPPLYDVLRGAEKGSPEYILPFYSQTVVELCLRIPSYLNILGGRDRAIARRAFREDVPEMILSRHWKDHPTGVLESLVMANLPKARELLLDGVLVQQGLLDRARLEEHLQPSAVKSGMFGGELFDHFACESWARRWSTVARESAAA